MIFESRTFVVIGAKTKTRTKVIVFKSEFKRRFSFSCVRSAKINLQEKRATGATGSLQTFRVEAYK